MVTKRAPTAQELADMIFAFEPGDLISQTMSLGAPAPIELDTVYDYDRFGNAVTITDCASDVSGVLANCTAGARGAGYRTTQISYSVSSFNAPAGTGLISRLGYGDGRFPVASTTRSAATEFRPVRFTRSGFSPSLIRERLVTSPNSRVSVTCAGAAASA